MLCWCCTEMQQPLFQWFLLLTALHLSFHSPVICVLFLENSNKKAYSLHNLLRNLNMKRRQWTVLQWLLLKNLYLRGLVGSCAIGKLTMLKQREFTGATYLFTLQFIILPSICIPSKWSWCRIEKIIHTICECDKNYSNKRFKYMK